MNTNKNIDKDIGILQEEWIIYISVLFFVSRNHTSN